MRPMPTRCHHTSPKRKRGNHGSSLWLRVGVGLLAGCILGRLSTRWDGLRLHQVTHEFGRQLGLLMGVADIYRLPIDDGQGVTQFVADVTLVTDGVHGMDEVSVV